MIGSLFSGIGGLELGLEWAGLGPVVWQVEKEPFCREVLAKHWPHVERFDDVKSVGADCLAPVEIICGGFPCQDISSAGKGAGLAGSRSGLWFEFARVVRELKPRWVVVENVASGAKRWVDAVASDLEQQGYGVFPVSLSAADVGAPHLRRRVFVIAHSNSEPLRIEPERKPRGRQGIVQREGESIAGDNGHERVAPYTKRQGLEEWQEQHPRKQPPSKRSVSESWHNGPPVSPVRRVDDGVSRGMDRARLKALGNAVVPQCAEVIGWMIREMVPPL